MSLFLFLASLSVPLLTPGEAIQKPLRRVRFVVDNESNSYLQCTQRASDRFHQQLDDMAKKEYERVINSQKANTETISKAKAATDACVNATKNVRASLVTLSNNGMTIPWVNDSSSCTDSNHSDIINFLDEDFEIVENEVSNVFEDYFQSSWHSVEAINSYSQARTAYDYDYFVVRRIEPILALLENAEFPNSFEAFIIQADLYAQFRSILLQVGLELDKASIQVDILFKRINEFAISIESFHEAYVDIYNRLEQAARFIQDVIPVETQVPPIFDLALVPLGDSLLPHTFQIPAFRDQLPSAKEIVERTAKQALGIANELINALEDQATDHLRATLSTLTEAIREILTFDEYDPPKFVSTLGNSGTPHDETEFLIRRAETAREEARKALDKLQGIGPLYSNGINAGATLDSEQYNFPEEQTSFQYLRPLSPSFSIPDILEGFITWIYVNTWILEVVVQAVRLWKIEAFYSRGAVPDLPKIVYNVDDEKEKHPKSSMSLLLLCILRTILTPWMILLIIFFPVCIGTVTFWYPHVNAGCTLSTNGTFFANKILSPLLINEASALGNGFYVKAEYQCQRTQRDLCSKMREQLDARYRTDMMKLLSIQDQHQQSLIKLRLVDICVDSNVDALLNDACCGLKGFPNSRCDGISSELACPIDETANPPAAFRPVKEYTTEPGCKLPIKDWKLQNSRFDCESISEICSRIPCDGVNEGLIRSQTIKSDCQVETYVIRCLLFALVALYHAIVINIICTLIFKGTRQVLWRRLCPDGVKLLTHINEDGSIVTGDNQSDRSKRVNDAIRQFELVGKLQLGSGFLVLIGWFISIFLIKG